MEYFVYVIQDMRVSEDTVYQIGDHTIQFAYRPVYVGRGWGEGHLNHAREDGESPISRELRERREHSLIERVATGMSWQSSVILESGLISTLGRSDLGTGPLLNGESRISWAEDPNQCEIGPLNLELNRLDLILSRLNRVRPIRKAADSLGVSERTLYRMIRDYRIEKTRIGPGEYEYYQT
jgi:hypothetical protein